MNQLAQIDRTRSLPALVTADGERAQLRFLEFFAVNVRNANTAQSHHSCQNGHFLEHL